MAVRAWAPVAAAQRRARTPGRPRRCASPTATAARCPSATATATAAAPRLRARSRAQPQPQRRHRRSTPASPGLFSLGPARTWRFGPQRAHRCAWQAGRGGARPGSRAGAPLPAGEGSSAELLRAQLTSALPCAPPQFHTLGHRRPAWCSSQWLRPAHPSATACMPRALQAHQNDICPQHGAGPAHRPRQRTRARAPAARARPGPARPRPRARACPWAPPACT